MKRVSAAICITLLAACGTMAETRAAEEADAFACPVIEDPEVLAERFAELIETKWDRQAMSCGAGYGYQLALLSPDDIELELAALGAQIAYLDALGRQYPRLYQAGELGRELGVEWRATGERGEALLRDLDRLEPAPAEASILKAAFLLASVAQEASVQEEFAAIPPALQSLERGIESDPEALDGLGLMMLGRLRIALPVFSGGNVDEAVELLEKGIEVAPESIEMHRWMVEAYLARRDNARAVEVLASAANLGGADINPQDLADILVDLGGLAFRLEQPALNEKFRQRRQALLLERPYLLQRKSTAKLGHGGVDPLTGQDPNEL
jgi:tetratricopeptide (TPR) repeat protein